MSVLKQKRTTSKAEFINTANQIYIETINFLTRLSARYSRLVAEPIAKLAGEIIDHAEKANSIFPSDQQRIELRKAHLLEARASLIRTATTTIITPIILGACGPDFTNYTVKWSNRNPAFGFQVKDDRCKRRGTSLGSQSLKLPFDTLTRTLLAWWVNVP